MYPENSIKEGVAKEALIGLAPIRYACSNLLYTGAALTFFQCNEEERGGVIKMALNAGTQTLFYVRLPGRTDLERKVKAHAWLYCASSSYRERGKQLGTLFFKAIKHREATQLSREATAQNGSARRPP